MIGTNKAPYPGYGSGRGYPDVSAAASGYLIMIGDGLVAAGGTSASAPVVAAIVSLVNAARLRGGGQPVGFINPILYASYKSFTNNVTVGKNNCTAQSVCCRQGYFAAPGWDPASGLGSLDYKRFRVQLHIECSRRSVAIRTVEKSHCNPNLPPIESADKYSNNCSDIVANSDSISSYYAPV